MRKTFTSDEIAHVWVAQETPGREGKCSSSMSFNGDAFYSYSTVIARIIRAKGTSAFVVDCARFSNTTSKHQSHVRNAIPDNRQKFIVNTGRMGQDLKFTPAQLRDYYYNEFRQPRHQEKSRYEHTRAAAVLTKCEALDDAIRVCEVFGISHKRLAEIRLSIMPKRLEAVAAISAQADRLQVRRDAAAKKKSQKRIADAIAMAQRIKDGSQELHEGNTIWQFGSNFELLDSDPELKEYIVSAVRLTQQAKIDKWLAGERIHPGSNWPTLLRLETNGSEMSDVVTTKGARVPVADAERTYRFIMIQRKRGWHKNGDKHRIGIYELEAVNEQGIVAGCHRLTWGEIERFAKLMGW